MWSGDVQKRIKLLGYSMHPQLYGMRYDDSWLKMSPGEILKEYLSENLRLPVSRTLTLLDESLEMLKEVKRDEKYFLTPYFEFSLENVAYLRKEELFSIVRDQKDDELLSLIYTTMVPYISIMDLEEALQMIGNGEVCLEERCLSGIVRHIAPLNMEKALELVQQHNLFDYSLIDYLVSLMSAVDMEAAVDIMRNTYMTEDDMEHLIWTICHNFKERSRRALMLGGDSYEEPEIGEEETEENSLSLAEEFLRELNEGALSGEEEKTALSMLNTQLRKIAKSSTSKAISIAEQVVNPDFRCSANFTVASGIARMESELALEIARSMECQPYKVIAMIRATDGISMNLTSKMLEKTDDDVVIDAFISQKERFLPYMEHMLMGTNQ